MHRNHHGGERESPRHNGIKFESGTWIFECYFHLGAEWVQGVDGGVLWLFLSILHYFGHFLAGTRPSVHFCPPVHKNAREHCWLVGR